MPAVIGRLPLAYHDVRCCKYSVSLSILPNVFGIIFLKEWGYNIVIKSYLLPADGRLLLSSVGNQSGMNVIVLIINRG